MKRFNCFVLRLIGRKNGKKRAELIAADPKSDEVIKPFLRGRDVKRWRATHDDLWLIKIASSANTNHPWTDVDNLEQIFRDTYPAIHNWFEIHRERLNRRDDQGVHFWELRSCAYWNEFEQPKIVYPNQCSRAEFCFEKKGYYTNQKAFIMTGCDRSLEAILNSGMVAFIFPHYLSPLQNGFWEPSKIFVEKFPIPPATKPDKSRLTELAESCAAATAADNQDSLAAHEAEINQIVYRLFDLTEAEIYLIESSLGIEQAPMAIQPFDLLAIPQESAPTLTRMLDIIFSNLFPASFV